MRRYTAAEARALREAATPGPWTFVVYTKNDAAVYVAEEDPEKHEHPHALVAGGVGGHRDAALLAAAPDLAATVEALEAELAEARLCLLAEAGDPSGAVGLRGAFDWRPGGWWRLRYPNRVDALLFRQWGEGRGALRARIDGGSIYAPAGLTIREAMRWVESQVLP